MKIINNPQEFDNKHFLYAYKTIISSIYKPPYFKNKQYYLSYRKKVDYNFRHFVRDQYPMIKICHINMQPSFLYGVVVDKETFDAVFINDDNVCNFGFHFLGVVPQSVMINSADALLIFDIFNRINIKAFNGKNDEIRHVDYSYSCGYKHVCTNKGKDITEDNFLYLPIFNALLLYREYLKCDNGGKFELECYKHGGSYYE